MSRIGKKPFSLPTGVTMEVVGDVVKTKGPKGESSLTLHRMVSVKVENGSVQVSVAHPEKKEERIFWGTFASHIRNMIQGVSVGYEKRLVIEGVGYTWDIQGEKLVLKVGFTHPVEYKIPKGIEMKMEKGILVIRGVEKQVVGQVAAHIREIKKPEPYKGKGIRYADEVIRRKAGKQAATAAK